MGLHLAFLRIFASSLCVAAVLRRGVVFVVVVDGEEMRRSFTREVHELPLVTSCGTSSKSFQ